MKDNSQTFEKKIFVLKEKLLKVKNKLDNKLNLNDIDSINSEWMSFDDDY
jgi:hypothetical protein